MATGQLIPGVSNNELIRTTWGNFVATELNVNTVKLNGLVPGTAGPTTTPQVMTGALTIKPTGSAAGLNLQNVSNVPLVMFQNNTGATNYGYVQGTTAGLLVVASVGTIRFLLGATEVAELASGLLKVTGAGRFGNTTGNQVQVVDTNGGGAAALATVGFYPAGTNIDTPGTRGGYVGFNGAGMELAANGFNLLVASTTGTATFNAQATAVVSSDTGDVSLTASHATAGGINLTTGGTFRGMVNPAGTLLWSKAASDLSNAGVEMFGVGSGEGRIASTVDDATATNLICRHEAAANADGKAYISFYNGSTLVSSITQDDPGKIHINNCTTSSTLLLDGLVQELTAKVEALTARVAELEEATP